MEVSGADLLLDGQCLDAGFVPVVRAHLVDELFPVLIDLVDLHGEDGCRSEPMNRPQRPVDDANDLVGDATVPSTSSHLRPTRRSSW